MRATAGKLDVIDFSVVHAVAAVPAAACGLDVLFNSYALYAGMADTLHAAASDTGGGLVRYSQRGLAEVQR